MNTKEKELLAKLIEIYREENYRETGNFLFSKSTPGHIEENGTIVSLCSYNTYQKLMRQPSKSSDFLIEELLRKYHKTYHENSIIWTDNFIQELEKLYDSFLRININEMSNVASKLLSKLDDNYALEHEYKLLFNTIVKYCIDDSDIDLEADFELALTYFPIYTKYLQYILLGMSYGYYTKCSYDCDKMKEIATLVFQEINETSPTPILLQIIYMLYESSLEKFDYYVTHFEMVYRMLVYTKNYNRLMDLYPIKLNYYHRIGKDPQPILREIEELLNRKIDIHPKVKSIWNRNLIVRYYDNNQYECVINLFHQTQMNQKTRLITVLLYYSSASILSKEFSVIPNEQIFNIENDPIYPMKSYFEDTLDDNEKGKLLLSYYQLFPQIDSLLNKLVYMEFQMLDFSKLSKYIITSFMKESNGRLNF